MTLPYYLQTHRSGTELDYTLAGLTTIVNLREAWEGQGLSLAGGG